MGSRDKLVRRALRERFVITLKSGETFDGLLLEADDKTFRLADAFAVDRNSRVSVDGELYLARADVAYLQKPGASA